VVLGFDYLGKEIAAAISIPRSWIVGPDGLLTAEHRGFDVRHGDGWLDSARGDRAGATLKHGA
jgi:hypothetical protein